MLVDSHCHLDYYKLDEVREILHRAAEAGVGEVVTIGTRLAQAPASIALTEAYPSVWCTVGVHPHYAGELPVPAPEEIAVLTAHPKVIGIGESGLDYFYDRSPREAQHQSFRAHIWAARISRLPLAIHEQVALTEGRGRRRRKRDHVPYRGATLDAGQYARG